MSLHTSRSQSIEADRWHHPGDHLSVVQGYQLDDGQWLPLDRTMLDDADFFQTMKDGGRIGHIIETIVGWTPVWEGCWICEGAKGIFVVADELFNLIYSKV